MADDKLENQDGVKAHDGAEAVKDTAVADADFQADITSEDKAPSLGDGLKTHPDEIPTRAGAGVKPSVKNPSLGIADYIAGEQKEFVGALVPFLPQELIGGSVPYVAGTEDEAVWNAAAQACGTEQVHYCYTVEGKRVWYLACPSSALASHPDSWCPLAAALPGNSEFWDKETVYLYEAEGVASALRWDPETGRMQVFLGASRTILPRVQSLDANFVTINPKMAESVPWRNKRLRTEKMTRATVRMLTLAGFMIGVIAALVLAFSYIQLNMMERNLQMVKTETDNAAMDLMINASNVMQSDMIKHMVRIQDILDTIDDVDGTLVKYQVNGKAVVWEALLPPAFAQDFGTPQGLEEDGRVRIRSTQ